MSPDAGLNSLNSARLISIDKSPFRTLSRAREVALGEVPRERASL